MRCSLLLMIGGLFVIQKGDTPTYYEIIRFDDFHMGKKKALPWRLSDK